MTINLLIDGDVTRIAECHAWEQFMAQDRRNWTHNEVLIVLALYMSRPFGVLRSTHPDVQTIAKILDRTPGAVSRKIGNLGSIDPSLPASGLEHIAKVDQEVWDQYVGNDVGMLRADSVFMEANQTAASIFGADLSFLAQDAQPVETERIVEKKERLAAGFFRSAVLSNFDCSCAITGLKTPQLLEAAHILSWAEHENLRLVLSNGLSLCTLLHRAYDANLIGIDSDKRLHVSKRLIADAKATPFESFFRDVNQGIKLKSGRLFEPNPSFLGEKYETYCEVQKHGYSGAKAEEFLASIRS